MAFDCRVVSSDLVGTHHVFFGEVEDIFIAGTGSPLIYANRAYRATSRIDTVASIGEGQAAEGNRLTLACFFTISAFTLPDLLRQFKEAHPEIAVTLIEGDHSRIHAALAAGEAEVALMYDENVAQGLHKEVIVEREPYVLLCPDDPLALKDAIEARDLAGRPMVLLNTPPSPDYFLDLLREQGVEPDVVWRSGTVETVRGLVANGLGFALLSSRPASDITYDGKRVVTRPLAWQARPSRVMLIHRGDLPPSPVAQRFITLCRKTFGASET